jgi:hypothetical protein
MDVHNSLALSAWEKCAQNSIHSQDIAVFRRRASQHFLTVELPALGKKVEEALVTYQFDITGARFKKKKGTHLPLFMYDLFHRVFHNDGFLRFERNTASSIRLLRQLTLMFYKAETSFTQMQLQRAEDKFVTVDNAVKESFTLEQVALIRDDFNSLLPDLDYIIPSHGSGVTVETLNNYEKTRLMSYPDTLCYCPLTAPHRMGTNERIAGLSLVKCPPAKITYVPKDSRGPRTIALQPAHLMFFQQGAMGELYDYIERASPARGYINFRNQTINQRLAMQGSIDGSYATIDLSDASDLVSNKLIELLVEDNDQWRELLYATRAQSITLGDGSIHHLKKYASMGSALCFPIEAMLFWSIARTVSETVYVYGDDIIVPNQYYGEVCSVLEEYGLRVNRDKSLHTGSFRESCGGEYYDGQVIEYVKYRKTDFLSWVAFIKNLEEATMLDNATATALLRDSEKAYKCQVLFTQDKHIARLPQAFFTHQATKIKCKWDKNLHVYRLRSLVPYSKKINTMQYDHIDYSNQLMKYAGRGEDAQQKLQHLGSSSISYSLSESPKYGWVAF